MSNIESKTQIQILVDQLPEDAYSILEGCVLQNGTTQKEVIERLLLLANTSIDGSGFPENISFLVPKISDGLKTLPPESFEALTQQMILDLV